MIYTFYGVKKAPWSFQSELNMYKYKNLTITTRDTCSRTKTIQAARHIIFITVPFYPKPVCLFSSFLPGRPSHMAGAQWAYNQSWQINRASQSLGFPSIKPFILMWQDKAHRYIKTRTQCNCFLCHRPSSSSYSVAASVFTTIYPCGWLWFF